MKCEEAGESISALCDGERIPREAAKHVGTCGACRARLTEYAEMGAELRRVASLDTTDELRPLAWRKEAKVSSSWWQKACGTMRIPKIAFASMLVLIIVLGSGVALLKARTVSAGQALMLTIKPVNMGTVRCALAIENEKANKCTFFRGVRGGDLGGDFRIAAKAGDRLEIAARFKFTSPAGKLSPNEVENWPETRYWVEPGQKLQFDVAGFGPVAVSTDLLDHMPSLVTSTDEQLDPRQGELRLVSPVLVREKETIFDFEGASATADENDGVVIYAAGEGRYVLSLIPIEGAVEGRIQQSRIHFEMDGKPCALLTGTPVARSDRVWILRESNYKPSRETPGFIGVAALNRILGQGAAKD